VGIERDGDIEGEFMKWILHTRWGYNYREDRQRRNRELRCHEEANHWSSVQSINDHKNNKINSKRQVKNFESSNRCIQMHRILILILHLIARAVSRHTISCRIRLVCRLCTSRNQRPFTGSPALPSQPSGRFSDLLLLLQWIEAYHPTRNSLNPLSPRAYQTPNLLYHQTIINTRP